MRKSKIKLTCRNGVWTAETVYYNVHMLCVADTVRDALRWLKWDMNYVEHGIAQRLLKEENS